MPALQRHPGQGSACRLACGSGRIAIPLAEAGKQVVGGNLSRKMLQRAQLATEARGLEAEFVRLDMRDFDLGGRRFDTIMVAANSVLHLHSFDDFMDFFRCVVRHLLVNGRLIFDGFVPNIALLNREPGRRYPVGTIRHDPLGDVAVDESVSYDPITHINTQPGTGRPTERETSGMPPLDCG